MAERKPRGHTKGRSDRPYRRRRAIFRAECAKKNAPCHLCQGGEGPINYSVSDRHPLGFQLDHFYAWSSLAPGDRRRWDSQNFRASHAVCNQRRKNKTVEEYHALLAGKQRTPPARPVGWG